MNKKAIHTRRHERLADELRSTVKAAQPGERIDSMEVIAARYDVSINTARMALVLLQHEGWVRLRHGSGCYVSRPESPVKGRSIAILSEYNLLLSPRSSVFSHIMNELRLFLDTKGHSSRLYIGHTVLQGMQSATFTCSDFLEDLALDRVSGVAALATLPIYSWTEEVRTKGIPIVATGPWNERFSGVVDLDCVSAIRDAILGFFETGRRRPAFIGWDKESSRIFSQVLGEFGVTPNPNWIKVGLQPLELGAGWDDFREIWARSGEKPDCVLFGDDFLFQDALSAIQACGVNIPGELELVVLANKGFSLPQPFPFVRMDCDPEEY
ncbi:MAG: GntR family transcriptional regulator, partial [bacterium]